MAKEARADANIAKSWRLCQEETVDDKMKKDKDQEDKEKGDPKGKGKGDAQG